MWASSLTFAIPKRFLQPESQAKEAVLKRPCKSITASNELRRSRRISDSREANAQGWNHALPKNLRSKKMISVKDGLFLRSGANSGRMSQLSFASGKLSCKAESAGRARTMSPNELGLIIKMFLKLYDTCNLLFAIYSN